MDTIDNGGQAFPISGEPGQYAPEFGMTLRDYFAAKAMAACISAVPADKSFDVDNLAEFAYTMADAMIRARGA